MNNLMDNIMSAFNNMSAFSNTYENTNKSTIKNAIRSNFRNNFKHTFKSTSKSNFKRFNHFVALGLAGAMLVGSMGADADLASANGYKNGSRNEKKTDCKAG